MVLLAIVEKFDFDFSDKVRLDSLGFALSEKIRVLFSGFGLLEKNLFGYFRYWPFVKS